METLKVLVVDDEPGIRMGVSRILSKHTVNYPFMDEDYGFKCLEAATGEEAIELIDRELPDIVLLDFTRIRLKKKDDKTMKINLRELAKLSVSTVKPYAIQKNVDIKIDCPSDLSVEANPVMAVFLQSTLQLNTHTNEKTT